MSNIYIPVIFAFLWSTGFIGAKYGLPYAEPFTLLAIRFLLTLGILSAVIFIMRPVFPKTRAEYGAIAASGLLIHCAYLGGVFVAISLGLPAGIAAMIVGMQPLITNIFDAQSRSIGIFLGLFIGFLGLVFIIGDLSTNLGGIDFAMIFPALVALLGITFGTIIQKKYCAHLNIVTVAYLQYVPVFLAFALLAMMFESHATITWSPQFLGALLWLSLALSVGAILLMNLIYKRNSASAAASYFYLAPPLTMVEANILFGEPINLINGLGVILIVLSLFISSRLIRKKNAQQKA